MYNSQSNKARYVYVISDILKDSYIKLKNNKYFGKESKSNEKLFFTENEIKRIIRTLCFSYVFQVYPKSSIHDMLVLGTSEFNECSNSRINIIPYITLHELVEFIDYVFGENFTTIAQRPLQQVLYEFKIVWQNAILYSNKIYQPTINDYILLHKFYNINKTEYSDALKIVLLN